MELLVLLLSVTVAFGTGYLVGTPTAPSGVQGDGLTPEQRVRLWIAQDMLGHKVWSQTADVELPRFSHLVLTGSPLPRSVQQPT